MSCESRSRKAAFDQGNCVIITSSVGREYGKKYEHVRTALLKGFKRDYRKDFRLRGNIDSMVGSYELVGQYQWDRCLSF